MAKTQSEAKALIGSLLSQGYKKAEIARKLGIDSSTITQIEKGKKPGRNLVEPLRAIAEKRESIPQREIRKTKLGAPAKVRQSKKAPASKLKRDSQGRVKIAEPTTQQAAALRRLRQIADAGGKVSVVLVFPGGQKKILYQRGGEYAARLLNQFENSGMGFFEWFGEKTVEFVGQQYGIDAEKYIYEQRPVAVGYVAIYGDAAILK